MPTGNGHQFSYQPFGPEQLSPRSTSSSAYESDEEEEDDDSSSEEEAPMSRRPPVVRDAPPRPPPRRDVSDSDDDDEENESDEDSDEDEDKDEDEEIHDAISDEEESEADDDMHIPSDLEQSYSSDEAERVPSSPILSARHTIQVVHSASTEIICTFTLEELAAHASDGGREILYPAEIESLASASRGSSRASMFRRELPIRILSDLRNLNCSQEVSSDEERTPPSPDTAADLENEAFYKWQAERRRRRVSISSSIGKRTHSELSGDSDIEEDGGGLDVNDVGFSARKMRKRQHRGSLLFHDPPEPRIDELEEPSSGEDEREANQALSRELPYARMEIIDMDDL